MDVLEVFPVELDLGAMARRLRLDPHGEETLEFRRLAEEALGVARPKAIWREVFVEGRGADTVTLDRVTFTSAVLRAHFESVERAFVYVATCGQEADALGAAETDPLRRFWMDEIKEAALRVAVRQMIERVQAMFALGKTVSMSPGSGEAEVWPIGQQRLLFDLLGREAVADRIGVRLTDHCLMVPTKSLSGVRFAAESDFRSCRLCRRERCPSRVAPFEPGLWESIQARDGA